MPHALIKNWMIKKGIIAKSPLKNRAGYRAGQQVAAELLGFTKKYFRLPHNPHAWRVSTQASYFAQHTEVLQKNIAYRLRSPLQFIVEAFAAHLEIKNKSAVIDNTLSNVQLKPVEQSYLRIWLKLLLADKNENSVFTCIQSIESASPRKQRLIFDWLERRIGTIEELCDEKSGAPKS
jgi:hypothetical protein